MRNKIKSLKQSNHNTKYNRSETAIMRSIFSLLTKYRGHITAKQVAKVAGVARQTLYNHHRGVNQAIIENEATLLTEFIASLDEQINKLHMVDSPNGRVFYALFIFMDHRRELFRPLCSDLNNQKLLHQMMEVIFSKLEIIWLPINLPAPTTDSERVQVYLNRCVHEIRKWGLATKCNVKKAGRYVHQLLVITETAGRHVGP